MLSKARSTIREAIEPLCVKLKYGAILLDVL